METCNHNKKLNIVLVSFLNDHEREIKFKKTLELLKRIQEICESYPIRKRY